MFKRLFTSRYPINVIRKSNLRYFSLKEKESEAELIRPDLLFYSKNSRNMMKKIMTQSVTQGSIGALISVGSGYLLHPILGGVLGIFSLGLISGRLLFSLIVIKEHIDQSCTQRLSFLSKKTQLLMIIC